MLQERISKPFVEHIVFDVRSHTAVVEAVVEVIRVIPEHTVAPRAGVLVRRNLENVVDVPMPQVVEDAHHGTNR